MKTIKTLTSLKSLLLGFSLLFSLQLLAQQPSPISNPIWSQDFNIILEQPVNDPSIFGWGTSSSNPSPVPALSWVWKADGSANTPENNWGTRARIKSKAPDDPNAPNGALVFDADGYNTNLPDGVAPTNFRDTVISETINIEEPVEKLYLRFKQYYRAYDSKTTILIKQNNADPVPFEVNRGIIPNWETRNDSELVLDISSAFSGVGKLTIFFAFEGSRYFWIVDDVEIFENNPNPTKPAWIGEYLTNFGYPYEIDSLGGVYVPNQYVVKYAAGVPESTKSSIREAFDIYSFDTCLFKNNIELWYHDPLQGQPLPPINEIVKNAPDTTAIEEVDLNHYAFSEEDYDTRTDAAGQFNQIPRYNGNALKIVIMDTGVDYLHDSLRNNIWKDVVGADAPESIYQNSDSEVVIGWDFVGDDLSYENGPNDKYPMDEHSHGTHVAGIVVKNLENCGCPYRIIPARTHDRKGISTLFDVACAFYYAIEKEADVINASFGYYGVLDDILVTATKDATDDGIVVVTAAGNDSLDLDMEPVGHYPGNLSTIYDNLITIGSLNMTADSIARFSNRSVSLVNHYAPGQAIFSSMPGGNNFLDGEKSGTSMAAPYITAMVTRAKCTCNSPGSVVNSLKECATTTKLKKVTSLCAEEKKDCPTIDEGSDSTLGIIGLAFALMMAILYFFRNKIFGKK